MLGLFLLVLLLMTRQIFTGTPVAKTPPGTNINAVIDEGVPKGQAAVKLAPEEQIRIERLHVLEKIAADKPDEVAALLKTWLSEDY